MKNPNLKARIVREYSSREFFRVDLWEHGGWLEWERFPVLADRSVSASLICYLAELQECGYQIVFDL